ncbi:hypothetical protein BC938DRAFT_476097, partial [Jimgerdemannia flammicorona]
MAWASIYKKWFNYPECHSEVSDHLHKTAEMVFAYKMCKKIFRKALLPRSVPIEVYIHLTSYVSISVGLLRKTNTVRIATT